MSPKQYLKKERSIRIVPLLFLDIGEWWAVSTNPRVFLDFYVLKKELGRDFFAAVDSSSSSNNLLRRRNTLPREEAGQSQEEG